MNHYQINRSRLLIVCLMIGLLFAVPTLAAAATGNYSLDWFTFSNGGGLSNGGDYQLNSTVGQSLAGSMKGGSYRLNVGYWPELPTSNLKLAILAPLTGIPDFGRSARDGALLAIAQQNASGGVLGMTIEAVVEDTACNATMAVNATNKVINQDGVKYIIGDVCSGSTIPMSEIANAAGVLLMAPSATNPQVTVGAEGQVKEYVFRACFIDPLQGHVMAKFAAGKGYKTAFVMVDQDNVYTVGLAQAFMDKFKQVGGQIVGLETYTSSDTDFSAILTKVKNSNADVLYLPDYYNIVNLVGAQAKQMGITSVMMGGDGWEYGDLDTGAANGGFFTTHMSFEDPRPEVSAFNQAFTSQYGYAPDVIAALAYDAAKLTFQGIVEAGTTDTEVVKTNLASISYQGVTGSLWYDSNHNAIKSVAVMSVSESNGVHLATLINPENPLPNLAINYSNGSPGSYFILTGTYFPPSSTATITINGHAFAETIPVNSSGGFVFRLNAAGANEGLYYVTASVNPSATSSFILDDSDPLHPLEGNGTVISVPGGIAYTNFNYLPLVQR